MGRQESVRKETLAFRDADWARSGSLSALPLRGLAAADRALTSRQPRADIDEMLKDIARGREL